MPSLAILLSNQNHYLKNWYKWLKGLNIDDIFVIEDGDRIAMRTYLQQPASFDDIADGVLNRVFVVGHGYAGGGTTLQIGGDVRVANHIRAGVRAKAAPGCVMRLQICDVGGDENIAFVRRVVPEGIDATFPNDLSCLLETAGEAIDFTENAPCGITDFGHLLQFLRATFQHGAYLAMARKFLEYRYGRFEERFDWIGRIAPLYANDADPAVRDFFQHSAQMIADFDTARRNQDAPAPAPANPPLPPTPPRRAFETSSAAFRVELARRFSLMPQRRREQVYDAAFGGNTGRFRGFPLPPPQPPPQAPPRRD